MVDRPGKIVQRIEDQREMAMRGAQCGLDFERLAQRLGREFKVGDVAGLASFFNVGVTQLIVAFRVMRAYLEQTLVDVDGAIGGDVGGQGRARAGQDRCKDDQRQQPTPCAVVSIRSCCVKCRKDEAAFSVPSPIFLSERGGRGCLSSFLVLFNFCKLRFPETHTLTLSLVRERASISSSLEHSMYRTFKLETVFRQSHASDEG